MLSIITYLLILFCDKTKALSGAYLPLPAKTDY